MLQMSWQSANSFRKKSAFSDIYEIIGQSMSRHTAVKDPDLDQILEIEKETYRWIEAGVD